MELFKNTNFDFLGKKWPFIILSLVLTVAGLVSIAVKGGLRYGIDFKGGALMTVKFAYNPPLEKIRSAMKSSQQIRGEVSVQNFTGATAQNEVEIGTELAEERQLNVNRQAMENVLRATFGQPDNPKLDFNNASKEQLFTRLRDALQRNGVAMTDQQV
jgi:preprotein translocase subunit SecF